MKKIISIEIDEEQIEGLKEVVLWKAFSSKKKLLQKHLNKLYEKLSDAFNNESASIENLKTEKEFLNREIEKLKFNKGLNNVLLNYHEQNFASAAADLLINPNPVEIHCTEANKGLTFPVSLMNVVAIKSEGRMKKIFLREAINPKEGGVKQDIIVTNNQDITFEALLSLLQNRGNHILRVSKSFALNIYHYSLEQKSIFVLNEPFKKGIDKMLINIKTDSVFNHEIYYNRLIEIDRLNKYHKDFTVNLKKIDEIDRYKKDHLIT